MKDNKTAIWFSGNSFKYEIEATAKLFFKAQRFDFYYDEKPSNEDFILVRFHSGKEYNYFNIIVNTEKFKGRKGKRILKSESSELQKQEKILCRLLYELLTKLMGIRPQWGLVTGIRPVKKVNKLIDENYSKEEIFSKLKSEYKITDSKLKLAYDTALNQQDILKNSIPDSIGFYISIPFCPTRCSYCSFVSQSIASAGGLVPDYVKKLRDEIKIYSKIIKDLNLKIESVYIGGGTPTILDENQLEFLLRTINENLDLSYLKEYCIEAGRPDTITKEKCRVIKNSGITRISVNPQTLNDDVLKAIGRSHTSEQTLKAYELVKSFDFDSINMDLIAGLPCDTEESFAKTLDKCIELDPENITVHTLTLKRSAELFAERDSEINSPVQNMVDYSQKKLYQNGYSPYYLYRQKNTLDNLENVGYAKKGKASLYNIMIMEEIQTIFAAGCGGSTKIVQDNGKITRIHNYKFPYEYIRDFDKLMEKKKQIYEILGKEQEVI